MKKIPLYKFYRNKYGHELLVDVIDIDRMRKKLKETPDLIMAFYAIFIITDGEERFAINGQFVTLKPKVVICARPGDVWSWSKDTKLKGVGFIFDGQFLLSFFNDPHFLDHFAYLQADRKSAFMTLENETFERISHLYKEMRNEIYENSNKERDQHFLRAMLYETLMLLNRAEISEEIVIDKEKSSSTTLHYTLSRYVDEFQILLRENYIEHHDVKFYAERLFITPNYLNKVLRQALGLGTKHCIQNMILDEAKRLLNYTTLSVAEIATQLNYETVTYFVRQFSKIVGDTPSKYREKSISP